MTTLVRTGKLAREYCNLKLPLGIYKSNAGYYIGTFDETGPVSRESEEYWHNEEEAKRAFESNAWTQRHTL